MQASGLRCATLARIQSSWQRKRNHQGGLLIRMKTFSRSRTRWMATFEVRRRLGLEFHAARDYRRSTYVDLELGSGERRA
jgi:hypothetical protein